jgi:hypothetical protein
MEKRREKKENIIIAIIITTQKKVNWRKAGRNDLALLQESGITPWF